MSLELGFETVGNATLVCHDRGPVLATDPWTGGSAYFGSWGLSHVVPEEQLEAVRRAAYLWVSHGHPDHLHVDSLRGLPDAELLLPDHVGGRIAGALRAAGRRVRVLPDRTWVCLSDRIAVCSVADYNQDAVLLVDVGGRLVLDVNDATDHGWRSFVRREVRRFPVCFLLALSGFGDADMINLRDEDGRLIPPRAASRPSVGAELALRAREFGARFVVPFSSMHRYERTDSAWANEYTTALDDYAQGFDSRTAELLPAFVRYDCTTDHASAIEPASRETSPRSPEEAGDHWGEPLEPVDVAEVAAYFRAVAHLGEHFGFVAVRVAGEEHAVPLGGPKGRGFTFEVPRASLMSAVRHRVFDDLLIGNFMRTIVHGPPRPDALYPHFTPYLGKYADNGDARSRDEVREYLAAYRRRAPLDFLRHRVQRTSVDVVRSVVPADSRAYRIARRTYHALSYR